MPAAFPADKVAPVIAKKYDLQVRSREKAHLVRFCKAYMDKGSYSPPKATPTMDYEWRFYTTRVAFAAAVTRAVLDIDYEKFKPQAADEAYHESLNQIWSWIHRAYHARTPA